MMPKSADLPFRFCFWQSAREADLIFCAWARSPTFSNCCGLLAFLLQPWQRYIRGSLLYLEQGRKAACWDTLAQLSGTQTTIALCSTCAQLVWEWPERLASQQLCCLDKRDRPVFADIVAERSGLDLARNNVANRARAGSVSVNLRASVCVCVGC